MSDLSNKIRSISVLSDEFLGVLPMGFAETTGAAAQRRQLAGIFLRGFGDHRREKGRLPVLWGLLVRKWWAGSALVWFTIIKTSHFDRN